MSNKFRFVIPNDEQYILLPIEMKWDMYGQEDSIELYEEDVIKDIIGVAEDFELLRFSRLCSISLLCYWWQAHLQSGCFLVVEL